MTLNPALLQPQNWRNEGTWPCRDDRPPTHTRFAPAPTAQPKRKRLTPAEQQAMRHSSRRKVTAVGAEEVDPMDPSSYAGIARCAAQSTCTHCAPATLPRRLVDHILLLNVSSASLLAQHVPVYEEPRIALQRGLGRWIGRGTQMRGACLNLQPLLACIRCGPYAGYGL